MEGQKMVIASDHPLAEWNEAFLIVSADDEFPTWHQRLYVFSTEDLAAGFALGRELANVAVRDIDCPAGLLELLADVEDEGCDGLSVDGVQLPLTDAIHSLQSVTS
jgi:hypothetical protein